ncbi:hypothetical protein A2U01_0083316, partial [Trifolium medium]|nr:hypothetical protein [Trifolium medium]
TRSKTRKQERHGVLRHTAVRVVPVPELAEK